jgi:3-phenylpropionate/trans-cinnamate dioxygenase ferredoxin reductase subunit
MQRHDVLIVGAGHAGAQAAIALRSQGFAGTVGLLGEEPWPPYERPPLSKEYLAGDKPFARLLIRPESFWAERSIDLLSGRRVDAVDPTARTVTLASGETLGWHHLVWAAGGAPRPLSCPGHDLGRIFAVRNRDDSDAILAALPAARQIIVVGGGYIGLETAAVLTKIGKAVTLLEAQDRVLARVAGPILSRFYEAEHHAHEVDIRTSALVARVIGDQGAATGVELADGTYLAGDLVIVGIGIVPCVEPLLAAGATPATGAGGVLVDPYCRTSLDGISAIGDCAAHASVFAAGAIVRLESVQNAHDQAVTAARDIMGSPEPYRAVPWFWSNQYDLKLQTVGLSAGHDDCLVRGDPATRSFSCLYRRQGRVIALDCVNAPRDYVQGRALVAAGLEADPALLANPDVPLKSLLPADTLTTRQR